MKTLAERKEWKLKAGAAYGKGTGGGSKGRNGVRFGGWRRGSRDW
jgi:hypothetical protein